jgi:hypothetical protein
MSINRDQVKLFLNNVAVPGIQSITLRPDAGRQPILFAGSDKVVYLPGTQTAGISINSSLISSDFFINFTGDKQFSGIIVRDTSAQSNISFTSGFLTSYTANFAVGQIPEVNVEGTIYGNFGELTDLELNGLLGQVNSQTYISQQIKVPSPGSIQVALQGIDTSSIKSCSINVNSARRADYSLSNRAPVRVVPKWPLQVSCRFTLDATTANMRALRSYEAISEQTDIRIIVDDFYGHTNICNYFFENMQLMSISPSADVGNPVSVEAVYEGLVYPWPTLPTEALVFYYNSSHPKNQNPNMVDLTVADRLGIAAGSPIYNGLHLTFDGVNDSVRFFDLALGPDSSFGVWAKPTDFAPNVSGASVFSLTNPLSIKGLGLLFSASETVCWASGEDTTNNFNSYSVQSESIWHHYAIVNDSVSRSSTLFYDGNQIAVGTYYDTSMITGQLRIGSSVNGGYFFNGLIDNLAVYNKTLSPELINRLYKASKPV